MSGCGIILFIGVLLIATQKIFYFACSFQCCYSIVSGLAESETVVSSVQ